MNLCHARLDTPRVVIFLQARNSGRLARRVTARIAKRVVPEELTVDLPALGATLRVLVQYAAGGGATESWLDEVAATFMCALLELAERRSGGYDPRRRKSRERGLKVASARQAGISVEALMERYGRSRSQVYRLMKVVAQHQATRALYTDHK